MSKITPGPISRKASAGKRYWLVVLKTPQKKSIPEAKPEPNLLNLHLTYMFELREAGKILLDGSIMEDSLWRGIVIFDDLGRASVTKLIEADPAVRANKFEFEILEWFGHPGDRLI